MMLGHELNPELNQQRTTIKRRESGELLTDIARSYNISPATTSRLGA